MTAPGWNLPCEHNPVRRSCPHRGKTCNAPAEPREPKRGDPCPECRRVGGNYGSVGCKQEHFEKALAKHKAELESWHKTWDEPSPPAPGSGNVASDFEPELPSEPVPMADHQTIAFQSATHAGRIEWNGRFGRYEATAVPRDWKGKAKRLPPQGAYCGDTIAEVKRQLREHVEGVRFADEPEEVDASAEARAAQPEPPGPVSKSRPELPARRAYELPKTADGDTLLVLPEERDVPPAILNEPRYVIWFAEWDEGKKKFRKRPGSVRTGKKIGPVEKYLAEFGTFAEARAAAERFGASGVGFVFLAGDGRVGIDFDHCISIVADAHGSSPAINPAVWVWLDKWLANTHQEISPSGDGIHIICRGQLPGGKAVTATPMPGANGVHVELYDHDRFLTFSAQRLGIQLKNVGDCEFAITKLLQHIAAKQPAASDGVASPDNHPISKQSARNIHADNLDALRKAPMGSGNTLLNTAAFFASRAFHADVFEKETTEEAIKDELFKIVTEEWEKPHPADGARQTIASGWSSAVSKPLAIRKETEADLALAEMNKKYFVITNYGNKCRVAWFEEEDHPVLKGYVKLAYQTFGDFKNAMLNKTVFVGTDDSGKSTYGKIGPWWLEHPRRREYSRVVFLPGQGVGSNKLNLWRGFACEPVKGDCSRYLNHLREIICSGNPEHYDYAVKWMARAVQRPNEQGHVALVWRGDKGAGKNIAANGFGDLFGSHCMTISNAEHLVGRFNAHLRAKCVLIANEAFYAGNKAHEATLKNLITEPTLPIEQKFVDAETDVNLLHLIVLSNNEWVVPASEKERRFFMLDVSDARIGDHKYFEVLVHELGHGGKEALLYHLLHLDLTGFNVRNVPPTGALRSQMAESLTGIEAVWYECLVRGELPGRVNQDGIAWLRGSDLVNWAADQNRHGWSGISDQKVGYLFGTNPRGKDKGMGFTKGQTGLFATGQRNQGWKIPSLKKARELWSQKRFEEAWDESAEGWRAVERS